MPFCTPAVRPTESADAHMASLWSEPRDLATRDLLNGPWGRSHAPDVRDRYTLVAMKHSGVNPGMTVHDAHGREWSVKLPPNDGQNSEAPIEVVLSRVLSAIGYHQPPVYYLPRWGLVDDTGMTPQGAGRFRLEREAEDKLEPWAWHENPFVGTRQLTGLFVIAGGVGPNVT